MNPSGEIYSISELSQMIQGALDLEPRLKSLWVKGEITNYKHHSSGHLYFSMKDENSVVKAVMFRGHAMKLRFEPKDGDDCFFKGYIGLYPKENTLQFYCEEIEPAGIGAAAKALEELKKRLQAKGYFDPYKKKELPYLPKAIGVISSSTGAVLQDIKKVTWRRYPGMPIYLYPAAVQGSEAVKTLVMGIEAMEKATVDVVIIGRGGGSKEDLSAFNEEAVAEALHRLSKPVISAVGHETDTTICDMVADKRAATPSMAAEMAVPVKDDLVYSIQDMANRLNQGLKKVVENKEENLGLLKESIVFTKPERLFALKQEDLIRQTDALFRNLDIYVTQWKNKLSAQAEKMEALSPLKVLARGYSVCKTKEGRIVTDASKVKENEELTLSLCKGTLNCIVKERRT